MAIRTGAHESFREEQVNFLKRIQFEFYSLIIVLGYITCLILFLQNLAPILPEYYMHSSLETALLDTETPMKSEQTEDEISSSIGGYSFKQVSNAEQFFYWLNTVFAPTIWKDTWYNYDTLSNDELYNINFHNKVIGGVHLYQTRFKTNNFGEGYCVRNHVLNSLSNKCIGGLSKQNFKCGTREKSDCAQFGKSGYKAFTYRCNQGECSYFVDVQLKGRWGKFENSTRREMVEQETTTTTKAPQFNKYGIPDGEPGDADYIDPEESTDPYDAAFNYEVFFASLDDMRWIDDLTKEIGTKFYVWNPNYKIWSQVNIYLDFNQAGVITPHFSMLSMQPDLYNTELPEVAIRVYAEIGMIITLILLCLIEIFGFLSQPWVYLNQFYNVIDMGLIVAGFYFVALIFEFKTDDTRLKMVEHVTYTNYVDWSEPFEQFSSIRHIGTMLLLINGIYCIRFFAIIPDGRAIVDGIASSLRRMTIFMGMYFCVHLIFAYVGMFLYGSRIKDFADLNASMYTMYEIVFCLYDVRSIYLLDGRSTVTFLFIVLSAFILMMLLLNVLLAILLTAYEEVKSAKDPVKISVITYFKLVFCCCESDIYNKIIEDREYKEFLKLKLKRKRMEDNQQLTVERQNMFAERYKKEVTAQHGNVELVTRLADLDDLNQELQELESEIPSQVEVVDVANKNEYE